MPQATFVREGQSIDYTPAADVALGEVIVLGDLVGVASHEIKANQLGSLAVEGVFDFAKAAGAIGMGTILYWDDPANVVSTSAAGGKKQIGKAIRAAAAADTTVRVKLSQ